jgi:predicted enzyme related to lactoylglutathione lyase
MTRTLRLLVQRAFALLALTGCAAAHPDTAVSTPTSAIVEGVGFAVGPQYETTHVYVAPEDVDRFEQSFFATFGGRSTKQVVVTATPTPSRTSAQLLQTPVGTVSLFGYRTPVPYPFGAERTGYLVTDLGMALKAARSAGADVVVEPYPDPIGRNAVIQWPGGVAMQLYEHFTKPLYAPLMTVPEDRVYVSVERATAFVDAFARFAHGRVDSDDANAPGVEIGRPEATYRRVRIDSGFGRVTVLATDGHLPYPYGRELAGYEVTDLADTLTKAKAAKVSVLVEPYAAEHRQAAMVMFPGGYVAEIHATAE